MTLKAILLLAVLVVGICPPKSSTSVQWTNLRVGFSFNPFSSLYYQIQPRSVSAMDKNEWTSLSGEDCTNGGKYFGLRYANTEELIARAPGMVLLYDVHGVIAGIQMILRKSNIEASNDFLFDRVKFYNPDTVNGVPVYVFTAYFVDPKIICTTGRRTIQKTGTGTAVRIQAGPSPKDFLTLPNRADGRALAKGWSKHRCVVGQGVHYFYKLEEAAVHNCTQTAPFFGLYDRTGDQIGFGFAATGKESGIHFENLPAAALSLSLDPELTPKCVLEKAANPGITTMHVFFTDFPNLYTCLF